ncbi:MAG: M3 family metallopeptidase [Planctomycetota bacterium]|jgi:thimet oligopeptidase
MDSRTQPLLTATPDQLAAACRSALADARTALDRFKALPPETAFEGIVRGWDDIGRHFNGLGGMAGLFFQVHTDLAVREQAAQVEQELSRFGTELSLDREAYDRLAALDLDATDDEVARRIVEHALRDFRRAGVDKDEPVRERVRALREELVEIGQEFSRNIAGDVRSIRIPEGPAGLDGLPEDFVAAHPPADDGSVTVTTNPTDYIPFMTYATHRGHREALFRAFQSRATPDNLDVLPRMIARRHELANLLGYPHWAAYVTEDKMIKTAENAAEFIGRVTELTGARQEEEVEELLALLRKDDPDAEVVRDWDRGVLMEQVRRDRLAFDGRHARPYFPYAQVKAGVLDVAARLYGLQFERADVPVWHPDVEAWDVVEDGAPRARFFLDMHPREDKYKHAAMFDLVSGIDGEVLPEACLVCNFPQPTADDAALLEPGDVTTFFHEFGHLLHHLLAGRQRWLAVSGISTEWDFVEVPSQLFEEWAFDAKVLSGFARHHETGEPIPAEMVQRMRAADEYGKGIRTRVQMFYAALALEYFSRDPEGVDTTDVIRQLKPRYVPFPFEEGTAFQAAFGHLDGYSALYYTYMWSLVLAKDLFSAFDGDLMNGEVAARYRRHVLEPGGSRDAELLVQEFLGRPSAFDAFERWLAA